jgi:CRISPR-associated protein Cmr6
MPARRRPSSRSSGQGAQQRAARQMSLVHPVPRRSAQAYMAHRNNAPQNPSLIFDRFAPDWQGKPTLKRDGLKAVEEAARKVDARLLQAWNARWEQGAVAAQAEPFTLKTDWRFITGLGRKGSLEVGFTFHRYGFPILPGSSVKGVARAYGLLRLADELEATDLKKMDDIIGKDEPDEYKKALDGEYPGAGEAARATADQFRAIFGTTGLVGRSAFLDAIPPSLPKLELDIMNPHYPDYYQGDQWPTDWQSPRPVFFLTVASGTDFRFAVGWRGPLDDEGRKLRDLAKEWLTEGLMELGAGAKTSAGYGYFEEAPR